MDKERLLGQKIDQYRIKEHIDRGGMADVYLAEDEDLERNVAFKVMLDTLALDEQFVHRFRREARTVARLDHPNIVQVHSTGQTPMGQPYIAMQYIEGGSLQEKLAELTERSKLLTAEQVLNIIRQLAIALGVAHKAEIVHRDLKPSNVLIRSDGTPVLVDLGIAAIRSGPKLTHTGGFVGTPAYMSPEQIRGKPIDGRSDLYSLGIICYELFAGFRPFDAEELTALMYKQIHEEPVPLRQLRPDLMPQTLSIVETLLKKEPEHRFQTANDLVAAIDRAILAEGGYGPNPHATQVLTHLDDNVLLPRSSVVQATPVILPPKSITAEPSPARGIPSWVVVTLLVLIAALVAFILLSPPGRIGLPTPTTAVSNLPTRIPIEAEMTEEAAVIAPIETFTLTPTATTTSSPTVTATETATATPSATTTATTSPTPTNTLQPTNTPIPTSTATPLPTNTPTATSAPQPPSGGSFPLLFEESGCWAVGDQSNGTLCRTTVQAREGAAGLLSYNFGTSGNDFVVFSRCGSSYSGCVATNGNPTALAIWVYGDNSGHYLNAWIVDSQDQTWSVPFGRITFSGWQRLIGCIDADTPWPGGHIAGTNNGHIDYPIAFRALVFDDYSNADIGEGIIYLDTLQGATCS